MLKNALGTERPISTSCKSMEQEAFSFSLLYETVSNASVYFDLRKASLWYSSN